MHLEPLLARERALTSTFQFHRPDLEVIGARFTLKEPAISERLVHYFAMQFEWDHGGGDAACSHLVDDDMSPLQRQRRVP